MAWDDILGQDAAKRLLQRHLASGQMANAYLFAGPEGVGKRRLAMEMAKALTCTGAPSTRPSASLGTAPDASEGCRRPCDGCASCRQVGRLTHPDVHVVVPEGAGGQIRIESVRAVLSRLALRPFSAPVQVAVIDGAERLTDEAANSLLKSLEEPSRAVRFFLISANLSQCLPTVVSRCQVIRCYALAPETVARLLTQREAVEPQTAATAARLARGSVSSALEMAKGWPARAGWLSQLSSDQPHAWLAQPLPETRHELAQWLDALLVWLRDVAVAAAADPAWVLHAEALGAIRRQAALVDLDRCLEVAFELLALRESLESFANPRLVATLAREQWLNLHETSVRSP